jgi:UDP-N-acetylmuramate--alanine ligase
MSAIATVLLAKGNMVSGTDTSDSAALHRLGELGGDVHAGHSPEWLRDADVVVRSTAVNDANPEVVEARRQGLRVWRRADVLAALCAERRTIAVSGTHGKTTTSSMLAMILRQLGLHPSMIIGGDIVGFGPGAAWDPAGEWFVVEADESDATFVELGAEIVVVTSVEPDHLEFYGGFDQLEAAFMRFVAEARGPAIVCADDPGARRLLRARVPDLSPALTYGSAPDAEVRISDVDLARGRARFRLERPGHPSGQVELKVPGLHNVRNAAAAVTAAVAAGADWAGALDAASAYRGVGRRFESRGQVAGVTFVDGYDHLPTEVAAAIATARSGGWDRVVVVFQPHRYSRTEALWSDFSNSFAGADVVVITGIYPAGEDPRPGITGHLIFDAVARAHPGADLHYAETLDQAGQLAASLLRPGDLCLTLGAGDITRLPEEIMARLTGPPAGTAS